MEDEEVSLFLVTSFDDGPYIAAIYEIKIGVGGGGSEIALVSPIVRAFAEEERVFSPVGCDISGSHMLLTASYLKINEDSFEQLQPLLFDTKTKECFELPFPEATKPNPLVMAVRGRGFYVLAGGTTCSCIDIHPPCFERLDPFQGWDDSSFLPEYRLNTTLPTVVSGYVVIEDCILISVYDFVKDHTTGFYYYRVGSKWRVVKKAKENGLYYPIFGKAEYVDGYIYTFGRNCNLIAYHVGRSNGVIQSIGVPVHFTELDFLNLPVVCHLSLSPGCLVHLGEKIFCMMHTGFNVDPSNIQYVSILIVQVSDDMELSTLWSGLCALNIKNLGRASLTSLFFDSQQSKYSRMSEFWTRGPMVQFEWPEDPELDMRLMAVKMDPPKLELVPEAESVDCFLQSLGLNKYSMLFKDKKIDKATLVCMTDEQLKAFGLRMGPRRKILSASETEV